MSIFQSMSSDDSDDNDLSPYELLRLRRIKENARKPMPIAATAPRETRPADTLMVDPLADPLLLSFGKMITK